MPSQMTVPKNLCLLRLSAIGDVCHAVAIVQHIQHHWPDIKITWVIGKVEANLLNGLAGVELVVFDKKAGLQGFKDLRKQLKDRNFDVLLHMQVAFRASLASLCIPAKVKIGFDKARAKEGQWLFTNKQVAAQTHPHVLDGFMAFADALSVPKLEPQRQLQWQMPLPDQDQLWASEQLGNGKPIAVISPAASKAERNWHSKGYAQTAVHLIERGFKVVLCGGPTELERTLAAEIEDKCSQPLINFVGKTSLKQLLAVLRLAHLVIAPDTGPAHMAVTVGTPVVGLYAHSNPGRTGPYLYRHYVVSSYADAIHQQYHKTVSQLPWGIRAKGSNLMNNITIEQVTEKVDQLIADFYPKLS